MSTLSVFTSQYPLLPWAGDGLGWAGGGLEPSVASSQSKRPLSYDLDVGIPQAAKGESKRGVCPHVRILEALEPQFKKTLRGNPELSMDLLSIFATEHGIRGRLNHYDEVALPRPLRRCLDGTERDMIRTTIATKIRLSKGDLSRPIFGSQVRWLFISQFRECPI